MLERRRRHDLNGVLERTEKQSKRNDWIEYQDYELREYERLKRNLEKAQARLICERKLLTNTEISILEEIQKLNFASFYGLVMKWDGKKAQAENKQRLTKRKLRLTEKRLKTAESNDLRERIDKAIWMRVFLRKVKATKMRLDKLQCVTEDAKRELEPHSRWLQGRHNEWDEFSEEGKRLVKLEVESTEYRDQMKKLDGLKKKEREASTTYFKAEKEAHFAEEGYNAARLDNFGEIVERAVLIMMVQQEVRSADIQFKEAKEEAEKIKLKRSVLSGLSSVSITRQKMERHTVLLSWIEQQRREIVGSRAVIERERRSQSRGPGSRVLGTHAARQKQSTARSILDPVDPTKVSKASSNRRSPRQKMSVLRDASQTAERITTDSNTVNYSSKQAFKTKDARRAALRPMHSSRVGKPEGKRSIGLPSIDTARLKRENNLGRSSAPSTGRKAMPQSHTFLRRSTRISKRPPSRWPWLRVRVSVTYRHRRRASILLFVALSVNFAASIQSAFVVGASHLRCFDDGLLVKGLKR